jgi:hypothetical protein
MSEAVSGSVLGFSVDTLDDTLLAVVQVTREHDLPVDGVSVDPCTVQVFCDRSSMTVWVRWLAVAEDPRLVAWRDDNGVHLHARGRREGVTWTACETVLVDDLARAGVDVDQVRDVDGLPVARGHVPVDPELMCTLLVASAPPLARRPGRPPLTSTS